MHKTLNNQDRSGKAKQKPCCPFCSMPLVICYGFYGRDHPERGELIKVQRYLCKAPGCPVKTFSIPPYPLLRIVRHVYRKVEEGYLLISEGLYQALVGRLLALTRGAVRSVYAFGSRFFPFLDHERSMADWGAFFETDPCTIWPLFIRDFSHAFYRQRYGTCPPTQ